MTAISQELVAIVGVGIAIGTMVLVQGRSLRSEIAALRQELASIRQELASIRQEIAALRERMAHLEGLLDGLRQAIDRPTAPDRDAA